MSPFVLALVIAQSTVVYVWTDKTGAEHFTDDLKSIPKGAKVRTTEGAQISRIDSDLTRNPRPVAVAAPVAQPEAPSTSEQLWRQLFRDARNKVKDLEDEIELDRKQVEEVNGLPVSAGFNCATGFYAQPFVTSGTSVTVGGQPFPSVTVHSTVSQPVYQAPCFFAFNPEYERIRERLHKNRREVVRAREDLADLERRASFEAVPLHWRR